MQERSAIWLELNRSGRGLKQMLASMSKAVPVFAQPVFKKRGNIIGKIKC